MGGVPPSSGVEYGRYVDPVIDWCTAHEWSETCDFLCDVIL